MQSEWRLVSWVKLFSDMSCGQKPENCLQEFLQSLCFTHEQHRSRFSAQTRSQQHQILLIIQVKVEQQTETGSDVLTLLQRSCDHVYITPTPSSALITTNSLHISVWSSRDDVVRRKEDGCVESKLEFTQNAN